MEIRIIPYGSPDYQAMIELRKRALLEPIGVPFHYIVPEKEKEDVFIGAFDSNDIIGCCVLTRISPGLVQLRQMAVALNWQGKRIGAQILTFAEGTARAAGYSILMMHARDPVIEFYSKQGYAVTGEPFEEVGIGHHKMQKEL
ncbi:MAG: GNAT family N-acetyltransferase [Flavisolibacter sp.]